MKAINKVFGNLYAPAMFVVLFRHSYCVQETKFKKRPLPQGESQHVKRAKAEINDAKDLGERLKAVISKRKAGTGEKTN